MARLVTVTRTFYVDVQGKRVKKGTRGAKKRSEKDPRWHGQDIPGLPPTKRVPLATDKVAAQRMLDNLVREAEQGTARLPNRDESRKSLKEHLTAFEADLAPLVWPLKEPDDDVRHQNPSSSGWSPSVSETCWKGASSRLLLISTPTPRPRSRVTFRGG